MDINEVWSEWRTEKLIGEGSYGKVYKCSKNIDGNVEYCAVKVISVPKNTFDAESMLLDGMTVEQTKNYYKDIVDRFVNEIQLMQKLKDCINIVRLYDYKVIERKNGVGWDIFIRMELLTTLSEYMSDKKMDREEVINLGLDICNLLVECGKYKIIHRDIKPENIFVYEDGIFKLGDFGTAKEFDKTLATYSMQGTYNYMSPEVFNGKKYDIRADIYSLGLVMYRIMNNNREPLVDPDKQMVKHQDRMDALGKRLHGEALPNPKNADESLSAIILKACEFKPENRYASVQKMIFDLEKELSESKSKSRLALPMKRLGKSIRRHKLATSAIASALIIAILGGTFAIGKDRISIIKNIGNKDAIASDNTTAPVVSKTDLTESISPYSIDYSGVVEGVYTKDEVDYVSDYTGIYKVTDKEKKALTNQTTTEDFTIINDKIYYTVVDKAEKIYDEKYGDYIWKICSGWVMNLDGSEQEKLLSYTGCGYVVYADDNNIYYADELKLENYNDEIGSVLYKYNISKATSETVTQNMSTENTFIEFTYVDGYILFADFKGFPPALYSYNIESSTVSLTSVYTNSIVLAEDNKSVYLLNFDKPSSNNYGDYFDNYRISQYEPKTNTTKIVNKLDDLADIYNINVPKKSDIPYFIFAPKDSNDPQVYFKNGESFDHTVIANLVDRIYDNCRSIYFENKSTFVYSKLTDEEEKSSFSLIKSFNGKETTLKSVDYEVMYENSVHVGKNCAVVFGHPLDGINFNYTNPTGYSVAKYIEY